MAAPDNEMNERKAADRVWVLFNPRADKQVVAKEISSEDRQVQASLRALMEKWASREELGAKLKPLSDGLWEIKFSAMNATFRLVFIDEGDRGVALHFFKKKSKSGAKVPPRNRKLYEARAKAWRASR